MHYGCRPLGRVTIGAVDRWRLHVTDPWLGRRGEKLTMRWRDLFPSLCLLLLTVAAVWCGSSKGTDQSERFLSPTQPHQAPLALDTESRAPSPRGQWRRLARSVLIKHPAASGLQFGFLSMAVVFALSGESAFIPLSMSLVTLILMLLKMMLFPR